MNQSWISVVIALVAVALVVRSGNSTPEPKDRPIEKWEYASLSSNNTWTTAVENLKGKNWKDLAEQMKIPIPEKTDYPTIQFIILDRLGSKGWELTGIERLGMNNMIGCYYFKRRKQ